MEIRNRIGEYHCPTGFTISLMMQDEDRAGWSQWHYTVYDLLMSGF